MEFTINVRPDGGPSWSRYIPLTGMDPKEADDHNTNGLVSCFREPGCMMGVCNVKKFVDHQGIGVDLRCDEGVDRACNPTALSSKYQKTWLLWKYRNGLLLR